MGLRDRYIGSLFRVDEPVPDDSEATGDTNAVYDLLGRKRDAQTKGLVIKNGIKVLK